MNVLTVKPNGMTKPLFKPLSKQKEVIEMDCNKYIAQIRENDATIDALEEQVKAFKARIDALKTENDKLATIVFEGQPEKVKSMDFDGFRITRSVMTVYDIDPTAKDFRTEVRGYNQAEIVSLESRIKELSKASHNDVTASALVKYIKGLPNGKDKLAKYAGTAIKYSHKVI